MILGADTVVVCRGKILGKPAHPTQAGQFLNQLQGTTHRVITAIALIDAATGQKRVAHAVSSVTMRHLTLKEIARYSRNHLDKAGAYAVQENKDPVIVKIRGSYTNVVGLPMELLKKELRYFERACPCLAGRRAPSMARALDSRTSRSSRMN